MKRLYCKVDLNSGLLTHTRSLEDGYVLYDRMEGVEVYSNLKGSYAWNKSEMKVNDMNVYIEILNSHMSFIYS